MAEAKAAVEKGYAGNFQEPPSDGPKAQKGKNVWFLSCGQAYEACSTMATSFEQVGAELGWQVSIQDGKADPTVASAVIRQAVAAKVDGIAVAYFDCPGIKAALLDAKNAQVPVVAVGSLDCNAPAYGNGDPSLFTAMAKIYGTTDISEFYKKWGEARALYVIARTDGTGNVLGIREDSQVNQQASGQGFADTMAKCTTCTFTEQKFTFSQIPQPATQQWQTAITSNKSLTTVANPIDALMNLGLKSAIQGSGRTDLIVAGGEGLATNVELIRSGFQTSATALPYDWFMYGLADTLNRVFAGDDPASFPNQGAGWQYMDAEHNLPAEGQAYQPSFPYKDAYQKIWNG